MIVITKRAVGRVSAVLAASGILVLLLLSSPLASHESSLVSTLSSHVRPRAPTTVATQDATLANLSHLNERAPPGMPPMPEPPYGLQYRPDSKIQLRLLSAPEYPGWSAGPERLPNYLADPKLGEGQDLYIIDDGFDVHHPEIRDQITDTFAVPNEIGLADLPQDKWPETQNSIEDPEGHDGDAIAIIAAGKTMGVASRANLILVKDVAHFNLMPWKPASRVAHVTELSTRKAWQWIFERVERREQEEQFQGFDLPPKSPPRKVRQHAEIKEVYRELLQSASDRDIIVVIAAGPSDKKNMALADAQPQSLGTANNALITVGGVLQDGGLDFKRTPATDDRGGSITLYAQSEGVYVGRLGDMKPYANGTAFSAAIVGGLAAYFASLESLKGEWKKGSVATDMKHYLRRWARMRTRVPFDDSARPDDYPFPSEDSIVVAYNGAHDGLSNTHAVDPPDRSDTDTLPESPDQSDTGAPEASNPSDTHALEPDEC